LTVPEKCIQYREGGLRIAIEKESGLLALGILRFHPEKMQTDDEVVNKKGRCTRLANTGKGCVQSDLSVVRME
jgi:hypothetical protein